MNQMAATFIVRLAQKDSGDWTAVVERVKTGEKFRVSDLDGIGALIARLASGQDDEESAPG